MTLEEAKNELEKFVKLKTTMRPAFLDVILKAEPVRHGKWIYEPKDAIEMMYTKPKCSVCGYESADGLHYCSNCGAKMDEVNDEVKDT